MRVINRNYWKPHKVYLAVFGLFPIIMILGIALPVLSMFDGMVQFQFDCGSPDSSTFLQANYTRLTEMAAVYDQLFEDYHIPVNQAIPITWDDTFTEVSHYHGDDGDIMIWTGTALAAQSCRYKSARIEGNTVEQDEALRVVRKLVDGVSMALKVPNGGLGPEYSAVLARYWGSPDHINVTPNLFDLENPPDPNEESFFNGTGDYEDYRWCGHTSNDQHAGFYLGLGMALEHVAPYDSDINESVVLMIDQICTNMINNDFMVIDGNGNPNGADQKRSRILGDLHCLTVLKLGATALPEKFGDVYTHYLLNEQYIETLKQPMEMETITSYYSLNFNFDEWLTLLTLEKDPVLKSRLLDIFESGIYQTVRFHRNAWFNTIYLAVSGYENTDVRHDVEDQLMRFNISHFPDRRLEVPELPMGNDPGQYQFAEGPKLYNDFFASSPFGGFYAIFFSSVGLEESKLYTNKPVTVEYRNMENFLWQRNPFRYRYPHAQFPRFEETGLSFMAPYWVGRAYGFFNTTGMAADWEGGE